MKPRKQYLSKEPTPKRPMTIKRQITKEVYTELGGATNPNLSRVPKNGKWTYWRTP